MNTLTSETFYAFVDCSGIDPEIGAVSCGTVGLTEAQYMRQLDCPDRPWMCPKCGAPAEYNDTLSEKAQGVS